MAKRLWKLLKIAWRTGQVTNSCVLAEGCFIPREESSRVLKQFHTISLLNIEGKIFLAVIARTMTSFMLANKYVDIAVQKGGVPGVSGRMEHTSALTQIIREPQHNKRNLEVLWLDLVNTYVPITHTK